MVDCALPLFLELKKAESASSAPTQVDLSFVNLDEAQGQYLARLIRKLVVLTHFHLKNCRVSLEATGVVCEELAQKRGVESMEIINCGVTSTACIDFAAVIRQQAQLLELNFSENKIGDDGFVMLAYAAPEGLKTLKLRGCALGTQMGGHLAALFARAKQLEHVDVSRNELKDACLARVSWSLKSLHQLHFLSLSATSLSPDSTDSLIAGLSSLRKLEVLDLSQNSFDNDSLLRLVEAFEHSPSMRELRLLLNQLTEDCLHHLAEHTAAFVPVLQLSFEAGERWALHNEKCGECLSYCLQYADICAWRRRRVVLRARLRVQRLKWAG